MTGLCYSGLMAGILMGLIIFFLGACVGSFLNVVVYRLNHQLSPLQGRSFCPKCKKKIFFRDNLPFFSFFLLRGRCRFCHSPISRQYPLVEIATGLLTLFIIYYSLSQEVSLITTGYWLLITYSFITLFVSDLLYFTLPDEIIYSSMAIAFFYGFSHIPYFLLAALGASFFFLVLILITRGKGMGWGDVKLVGLMGLILGSPGVIVALVLAFLTGALVGVILISTRKKRFGEHLPFGPFLTSATWVSLFWGQTIWQVYLENFLF